MNLRNKSVLMTGASGFVGACLVRRLLKEGAKLHLILRPQAQLWRLTDILPQVRVYQSDLSDEKVLLKIVDKSAPSVIYHLSAHGAYAAQNDAQQIFRTNLMGGWNLLNAANKVGYGLFVNTGSSSEYGYKKKSMKETDVLQPESDYAVSKASFTQLCGYIARRDKKPVVTLRPFSVYGPYEQPTRFVPTLLKSLYFKQPMDLVAPATARDFIYVDDMVEAYLRIDQLKRYPGEIFNVGTGKQHTIEQVVKAAVYVSGCSTNFRWGRMPARSWDTNCWVADIRKASSCLDWAPQYSLKKGLSLMWAWYKENKNIYGNKD